MAVRKVQILVEGVNDLDFLGNYLMAVFQAQLLQKEGKNKVLLKLGEHAIVEIRTPLRNKGWGYIQTADFINDLRQADAQGYVSLVILDADIDGEQTNGGYANRTTAVNAIQGTCGSQNLSFEYFLLPNDGDSGQVETLLINIMQEDCKAIFDCIEDQEACIRTVVEQQSAQSYIRQKVKLSPDKEVLKTNMRSFKGRLGNKTENKFDRNRGFQNTTIWNLQHPYLDPLKDFLTQHLL